MAINLAEKYSSKVDEIIKDGALSDGAINSDYDFVGAQSVKVYSFDAVDLNDYNATGSNRYGSPTELQDSVQEMTMSQKRSFSLTIDKTNAVDSPAGVRDAGKALRRQLDLKIIPEIDTYRFAKIANGAGKKTYATVSGSTAYSAFLASQEAIDNAEMPVTGRKAYVSPAYLNMIKVDTNFTKACDIAQGMLAKGQVGEIDGVAIFKAPTSRLPAGVSYIITNPIATTAPSKIADYKIHQDPPGIAGNLIEGLVYYDAFVLNNKKNAIAVHYGALGTLTASMAAATSGKGTVTYTGNTNGGTVVYKTASAVTAPALGDDISSWTALPADGVISATSGHKYGIAVKDSDGRCVAVSAVATVTVG